jgi:hypothetical protein
MDDLGHSTAKASLLCPKAASGRAEQVADALSALATDTQAQELVKAADETDAEMAETTMYE